MNDCERIRDIHDPRNPMAIDHEWEAAKAETEAMRAKAAYVRRLDADDAAAEAKAARLRRLEAWNAAGLESIPMVEPGDPALADMPLSIRMQLETHAPELARELLPVQPLPAGVELRLAKGLDFLQPEDVPALLDGGHAGVVEKLRARHMQQIWEEHETAAAAQAAQEAELAAVRAQEQQESLERFNQQARAHAISRMNAGLPPAPIGL